MPNPNAANPKSVNRSQVPRKNASHPKERVPMQKAAINLQARARIRKNGIRKTIRNARIHLSVRVERNQQSKTLEEAGSVK
jgi:hypothetical protein